MTELDELNRLIPTAENIDILQKTEKWDELCSEIETLPNWMRGTTAYTEKYQEAKTWRDLIQKEKDLENFKEPHVYENFLCLLNNQTECETKRLLRESFIQRSRRNIFPTIDDLSKLPLIDHLLGSEIREYQTAKKIERLSQKAKDLTQNSPEYWLENAQNILLQFEETKDPLDADTLTIKNTLQFRYATQMKLVALEKAVSDIDKTVKEIKDNQNKKPLSIAEKFYKFFSTKKRIVLGAVGLPIILLLVVGSGYYLYSRQRDNLATSTPQNGALVLPSLMPDMTPDVSNQNGSQGSPIDTSTPSPTPTPTETVTPTPTKKSFRVILIETDKPDNGVKVFITDQSSADDFAYILFPANSDKNEPDGKVKILVSNIAKESNGRIQVKLIALIDKKFIKDGASKGLVTFMNLNSGKDTEIPRLRIANNKDQVNPIQWGYITTKGLSIQANMWEPDDSENIPKDFVWIEITGWMNTTNLQPDSGN